MLLWCCYCRYSSVRKQFGPTADEEIPVIEYQLQVSYAPPTYSIWDLLVIQQWRLLPLLSATFAITIFSNTFFLDYINFHVAMVLGDKSSRQVLQV